MRGGEEGARAREPLGIEATDYGGGRRCAAAGDWGEVIKLTATKKLLVQLAICLGVTIGIALLFVQLSLDSVKIRGQKLEGGMQAAYGTITSVYSSHGRDWHMRLDSSSYTFEFPDGTFTADNHPRVGDSIAVAYEWKLQWYSSCSYGDGFQSLSKWSPVVLDWEVFPRCSS